MKRTYIALYVVATIVIVAVGIILLSRSQGTNPQNNSQQAQNVQTIDGISCLSDEKLSYHIHTHLDIFANGQPVTVPAKIGIPNGFCFYFLHTHNETGIIHAESPVQKEYTIGNFFHIWGKTLSRDQILDYKADADHPLRFYVDGKEFTDDPGKIVLDAHREIVVVYGQLPANIPSKYDFPAGL